MSEQEFNKVFAKNLNSFLYKTNHTQVDLAKYIGVSTASVSNWCKGIKLPRMDKVDKMCAFFNCKRSDLMEQHENNDHPNQVTSAYIPIPVYASVSAGPGCFADGNIESYIEIPEEMARKGDYFALRVRGDSMEPDIKDGDIIIARRQDTADNGKVVVAIVNGDEGFCKRLSMYAEGLSLVSNNPAYLPKYYSADQVRDLPVTILGVVERLIREF